MNRVRIIKGLELPISGQPEQAIYRSANVASVALLGGDYVGLRPVMQVAEGEQVRLGQSLFVDRRDRRISFTAPGTGRIRAINRGARRRLVSIVIDIDDDDDEMTFQFWPDDQLAALRRDQVTDVLLASGLWTALRTRPFSRRADPDTPPSAIFVTATDSNPLASRPEVIVNAERAAFANGLTVISHLTNGSVYVCQSPRADLPTSNRGNVVPVEFSGPHPTGLVGTHIHLLHPASTNRTVWHLGYQDVIAIGKLFTTGKLWAERIISLAGPVVRQPRLVRARLGASVNDLIECELEDARYRVVSGSILSGRSAVGAEGYLGRFHNQIAAFAEQIAKSEPGNFLGRARKFTTYGPGVTDRPPERRLAMTTAQGGQLSPLLPLGGYERVMPLDILPTPLIRALLVGDREMAEALGCLELDEEDLALCSFVCPSKIDHGRPLREMLDRIAGEQ